eukprot:TRINITY_DN2841_c0_g1_i2.p1 TRINITY_DN2841_c0_g1~~TRINITY_DN2841_c0_g1_i2.p1  ORF type:complete len:297 (-),score=72.51 TRINITY_DN2841_c0_g1_i2:223-1113(-)
MLRSLVGSEMCIRDRYQRRVRGPTAIYMGCGNSEEEAKYAPAAPVNNATPQPQPQLPGASPRKGLGFPASTRMLVGQDLWEAGRHQEAADVVIANILELNPESLESAESMKAGLEFSEDGTLKTWDLNACELASLPESFGAVRLTGDLILKHNQLTMLPASFGRVQLGGELLLHHNNLSALPDSFGELRGGGDIDLQSNQLSTLPLSMGDMHIHGDLDLHDNMLSSLPEHFSKIEVQGDLILSNNQLSCLPKSITSIQVGGDVHLQNNLLPSDPPPELPNAGGQVRMMNQSCRGCC